MALAVDQALIASDIMTIAPLKAGIVFALKGFGNDEVVVKLEPQSPEAYKMAGKVVKLFDPSAKAFVLSATEVDALKFYCKHCVEFEDFFGQIQDTHASLYSKDCVEAARDILKELGRGCTAIKMQKLNIHTLESALSERHDKQNKQPLKEFCKILKSGEGLSQLGMIMAGDAFIGNSDRFSYQYGVNKFPKFGGMKIEVQVLNNIGNVMWVVGQGGSKLSMLDYVDSGSSFKNWGPLTEGSEKWPIRFLADKKGRFENASKVVSDLEAILSPKSGTFSRPKLDKGAAETVAYAINTGLMTILSDLKTKVKSHNCQKGLQERYLLLQTLYRS